MRNENLPTPSHIYKMEMSSQAARIQNLVLKASQGDQDAFGNLYELFLDQIYRYVYFRVGNQEDAEDLTENSFVKAWQAMLKEPEKPIRNFSAWIYSIARNLITDHFRRKKPVQMEEIAETIKMSTDEVEDTIIEEAEFAELAAAMQNLDERSYQVIQLRFLLNRSHAETAAVLDLEEGHIRVLQYRALKKLKLALERD